MTAQINMLICSQPLVELKEPANYGPKWAVPRRSHLFQRPNSVMTSVHWHDLGMEARGAQL